jgi:hypothetical protein
MIRAARNIIAGLLVAYGFVSFFCFLILDEIWTMAAPSQMNEGLGLIFKHNEHGNITYFSEFQATACAVMLPTSIPLIFLGMLIVPKLRVPNASSWYAATFTWGNGHPAVLAKRAAIFGAVATPPFVVFVGPYIIRSLNAMGFVLNSG